MSKCASAFGSTVWLGQDQLRAVLESRTIRMSELASYTSQSVVSTKTWNFLVRFKPM